MAYILTPPPSVEDFLDGVIDWVARNLRAKITVHIEYSETKDMTLMCDRRVKRTAVRARNGDSDER